jgi:uncharacterized protein (DUF1697 family)
MRYVAFLRGINVGGRTIPMAALRVCCEEMDLEDISTVLQSGNVLFSSAESAKALKLTMEMGLRERFDYPARVQIYPLATLRKIVDTSPFSVPDPLTHSYVVFFEKGLEQQLMTEVGDEDNDVDRLEVGDGVIYWRVPKGSTVQSGFAKHLTKARYKDFHTSRNINTLRKVLK